MAVAERFTQMFREEHRVVRDALLDLVQAFRNRDNARIQSLLGQAAAFVGPHFRYEEEALYPGLVGIFEKQYVEELLGAHDRIIGTAKKLVELAGKVPLTQEDVAKGIHYIGTILPHVSDCDGLSIMVERLPEQKVQEVFAARDRALAANLDLLTWAAKVRERPAVMPE